MERSSSTMITPFFHLYFLLLILLSFCIYNSASVTHDTSAQCNGSIANCNADLEMAMESEVSRRFLEQQRTISYGALKGDQPACHGGASGEAYSKTCLSQPSNPYNRGCSKYYRCRGDS